MSQTSFMTSFYVFNAITSNELQRTKKKKVKFDLIFLSIPKLISSHISNTSFCIVRRPKNTSLASVLLNIRPSVFVTTSAENAQLNCYHIDAQIMFEMMLCYIFCIMSHNKKQSLEHDTLLS